MWSSCHVLSVPKLIINLKVVISFIQVPQGTTPRSIIVHLRGALTRTCKPGDAVSISGVFLPEPYTGFKAIRAGLLTSTYLDAMGIKQLKQSYQEHALDEELQARMYVSSFTLFQYALIDWRAHLPS